MLSMIEVLSHMDAPFAFALIGVAWAVSMPLIIRRTLRNQERIEELRLQRAIQLESFKKGALTYAEEQ
jgi:hypothetical protein